MVQLVTEYQCVLHFSNDHYLDFLKKKKCLIRSRSCELSNRKQILLHSCKLYFPLLPSNLGVQALLCRQNTPEREFTSSETAILTYYFSCQFPTRKCFLEASLKEPELPLAAPAISAPVIGQPSFLFPSHCYLWAFENMLNAEEVLEFVN